MAGSRVSAAERIGKKQSSALLSTGKSVQNYVCSSMVAVAAIIRSVDGQLSSLHNLRQCTESTVPRGVAPDGTHACLFCEALLVPAHPTQHAAHLENSPSKDEKPQSLKTGKKGLSAICWHQFHADVRRPSIHDPAS